MILDCVLKYLFIYFLYINAYTDGFMWHVIEQGFIFLKAWEISLEVKKCSSVQRKNIFFINLILCWKDLEVLLFRLGLMYVKCLWQLDFPQSKNAGVE